MKRRVAIGLAPGGTADRYGLSVVEVVKTPPPPFGTGRPEYHVVDLPSIPAGTNHERILARLRTILTKQEVISIIMDQTEIGAPMFRMMSEDLGQCIDPAIIGRHHTEHQNYVPRNHLVSALKVVMTKGRLRIAKRLAETQNLTKALLNYENRPTSPTSSNDDPWREHPSDHLIFAVALPIWKLENHTDFSCDWI